MSEQDRQKLLSGLTPRQLQILRLLQEGKPNKALSEELGIGLGTVKQHLVALFKKLNVKNRAMAASLAIDLRQERETAPAASLRSAVLLDSRPCVVLSVSLPQDAAPQSVRLMLGSLAATAAANEAIFLARPGNAGDVIFGIQRANEYVVAIALQTAQAAYSDLLSADAAAASGLRGCLTAGHAFASMHRSGGWTGEALASAALSSAREMLETVAPGSFAIDRSAHDLTSLFGIEGMPEEAATLAFSGLAGLRWSGARPGYDLTGRSSEAAKLFAALGESAGGRGRLFHIEGEMGMGKSRLCEEIHRLCLGQSGQASFYRCLPAALGGRCYDTVAREYRTVEDIEARLRTRPDRLPELVIVDDVRLLPAPAQARLADAVAVALRHGKLVVLASRKLAQGSGDHPAERIVLRRMPPQSLQGLVRKALGKEPVEDRANRVASLCSTAAGVPLFAIELARHHRQEKHLPLSLQVTIHARLDGLNLDRRLLREVAGHAAGIGLDEAARNMGEDPAATRQQADRAAAVGVLTRTAEEWISFTHPLLRLAVNDTITD